MRDLVALLERVGFTEVEHAGFTGVTTSRFTCGAEFRALRPSPSRVSAST